MLNPAMDRPEVTADMARTRRAEMARAREILGVQQRFLGFVDSGLPEGDPKPPLPEGCFALTPAEQAAEPLVRAVREFRPHVILTYDENGGYPHPDHVMTHQVAVRAFETAADPDAYPGTGEPWQPLKLYYFVTFHRAKYVHLHEEMLRRGLESPYEKIYARARAAARRGLGRAGDHHQGGVRRLLRLSGTRRCGRTPARSTRTASGSPARWTSSAPRGRQRIIIWLGQLSIPSCRRTTCSPASGKV